MSRLRNCFLCFIRRFWNQVLTCVSLNPSAAANSTRSGVDKYLFSLNTKDVFNELAFSDWKLSAEFVFWKKKKLQKVLPLIFEALFQSSQLWITEHGASLPSATMSQCVHIHSESKSNIGRASTAWEEIGSTKQTSCINRNSEFFILSFFLWIFNIFEL